jgi:hypothetical protein
MKTQEYKNICKYSDKVLFSKKSNHVTHAISHLHVLKEHPEVIRQYSNIPTKNFKKIDFFSKILIFFFYFFLEKKNFYKKKNEKKIDKVDYLIISPLINSKFLNLKEDFYFGTIEEKLKKKFKVAIVLRNFTNIRSKKLFEKLKNKNRIILSSRSDIFSELSFVFLFIWEYIYFKVNFKYFEHLSILDFASIITNLRLVKQVIEIIKITNPRIVLFTFEGHAWERVLNKAIKNYSKKILTAGYQFTVTTKHQHSLFRPLKLGYNPDYIFTTGEITKKKFINKYKRKVVAVETIGSNKFTKINKKKYLRSSVLIVPEAFESETKKMLQFSIDSAGTFPNKKFIFRMHPMHSKFSILSKTILPENLIISKQSLNKDMEESRFLIFRGSAVAFQACMNDILPIYLKFNNELNFNPMFEVFPNILNIKTTTDLKKIFLNKKLNKHRLVLKKFSNKFFEKNNFKFLAKI